MLIRQKLRTDFLEMIRPLEGKGIEVRPLTQGNQDASDRVVVSTFNLSQVTDEDTDPGKLGDCCVIKQTIEITLELSTPICATGQPTEDQLPENRLDRMEELLWPYIGSYRSLVESKNVLFDFLGDDVDLPEPDQSNGCLTRLLSFSLAYRFSPNAPDTPI